MPQRPSPAHQISLAKTSRKRRTPTLNLVRRTHADDARVQGPASQDDADSSRPAPPSPNCEAPGLCLSNQRASTQRALEARALALDSLESLASESSMDPRARARLHLSPACHALEGRPPHRMSELVRPLLLINHHGMSLRAPSFAASCLMAGLVRDASASEWIAACLRAPLTYYRVLTGGDEIVRAEDVLREGVIVELAQDLASARPTSWSVICARIVDYQGVAVVDASASTAVPSRCIGELRAYARAITRSSSPMDVTTLCRHDLALLCNFASVVHGETRQLRCGQR